MLPAKSSRCTYRNHFEHGFVHGHPTVYFSKFAVADTASGNAFDESVRAAKLIAESALDQTINLCISGGVDSEVMLKSFLAARVPFKTTVLRFSNALNEFDIYNAIDTSRSLGIEPEIVELDAIDFFERGLHLGYGRDYRCQSPQLAVHLWMLDQIDGFPVLSGNFIYPEFTSAGVFYVGLPGDLHGTYFRYFEKNARPGVPWFLIYTPEQNRAFFQTPILRTQIANGETAPRSLTYDIKCRVYQEGGFNVLPRPDKYTGFEKIREHYDRKYGTHFGVKFDELFRKPLLEMNPLPEEYIQILDGSL